MHRKTQMEHPVALDDHFGILEHQVSVSERPEDGFPRRKTIGTMSVVERPHVVALIGNVAVQ